MRANHALIGLVLLALGALGIVGYWYARPLVEDLRQRATSDASATKGTIRVGMDSWVGYVPLCSAEMRSELRAGGYLLKCLDDSANYPQRFAELRAGELDLAVATVDSYLLGGAREGFPATIVTVIDESRGGDAVVARKARVAAVDDLKRAADVKIAFTPASPSEHLLRALAVHFDIAMLRNARGPWRVEAAGSADARKRLLAGEVDVAVLWEPDVSGVLADPAYVKLLGTEDTEGLIVDVLLARRAFSTERPDAIRFLLASYFRALRRYRDQPDALRREVATRAGVPEAQARTMLDGVRWFTLEENAQRWFGVRTPGARREQRLVEAIDATLQILRDHGDVAGKVLPDDDPYRIVWSEPVETLAAPGMLDGGAAGQGSEPEDAIAKRFTPLGDQAWAGLREIGTLRVRPIAFQSGTDQLSLEGKRELDQAVLNLRHYPNFRVVIEGHTAQRGDDAANQALSQARAEAVARYLQVTYGIDPNRLRALGRGGSEPLPREPGETDRAYAYRLPRVELYLVAEVY